MSTNGGRSRLFKEFHQPPLRSSPSLTAVCSRRDTPPHWEDRDEAQADYDGRRLGGGVCGFPCVGATADPARCRHSLISSREYVVPQIGRPRHSCAESLPKIAGRRGEGAGRRTSSCRLCRHQAAFVRSPRHSEGSLTAAFSPRYHARQERRTSFRGVLSPLNAPT